MYRKRSDMYGCLTPAEKWLKTAIISPPIEAGDTTDVSLTLHKTLVTAVSLTLHKTLAERS
ncbi:hypothetical protein C7Y47_23095 [Lysinibacillus sphaericus]|uniref:Uncharacterized protein n=1 Tax=Lysinibacillus sphaericus TaxID=1421 RepID=A0A544U7Z0_LYSSH|nr:hypothetical protein C7Y47_23095 [Lysinibacillus sp. SDF0037]